MRQTKKFQNNTTISNKTCRLVWGYRNGYQLPKIISYLALLGYVVSFGYGYYVTDNFDIFIVGLAALVLSGVYNKYHNEDIISGIGSIWCFTVNLIALFIILTKMTLSSNCGK